MFICVDFDGTMVNHVFPEAGQPVPGAVEWCKRFVDMGCHIILWTMRDGKHLQDACDYMNDNGISLFGINQNPTQYTWTTSPKAYGHIYIDDAAIGCPLIYIEGWDRPCVNWDIVGSIVIGMLNQ